MSLTKDQAVNILTEAKSRRMYEGSMDQDEKVLVEDAASLVTQAKRAWDLGNREEIVERILHIAQNGDGGNGSAPPAAAESAAEEQTAPLTGPDEPFDVDKIIDGYDDLKVAEIVAAMDALTDEQVIAVKTYESANGERNRIMAYERPEPEPESEPAPEDESAAASGDGLVSVVNPATGELLELPEVGASALIAAGWVKAGVIGKKKDEAKEAAPDPAPEPAAESASSSDGVYSFDTLVELDKTELLAVYVKFGYDAEDFPKRLTDIGRQRVANEILKEQKRGGGQAQAEAEEPPAFRPDMPDHTEKAEAPARATIKDAVKRSGVGLLSRERLPAPADLAGIGDGDLPNLPFDFSKSTEDELISLHARFHSCEVRSNVVVCDLQDEHDDYVKLIADREVHLRNNISAINEETGKPKTVDAVNAEIAADPKVEELNSHLHAVTKELRRAKALSQNYHLDVERVRWTFFLKRGENPGSAPR